LTHQFISTTPKSRDGDPTFGSPYTVAVSASLQPAASACSQLKNQPWPLAGGELYDGRSATHAQEVSLPAHPAVRSSDAARLGETEQLEAPGVRQPPPRKSPVRLETP